MDISAGADVAGEESSLTVTLADFVDALDKVGPSVSVAQRRKYEALRAKFAGLPVRVGKEEEEKRVDA
jgi:ribosome biogenesis ATPase